ncbi:MAG: pyruvate kinase [Bacteroidetes bacterium]|nr:pyruvate kinase [Bacteroidota bacterium]
MKQNFNKTKIVATIGPACNEFDSLSRIIEAGTNVCRLNFSHGKEEDHLKVIELIRDYNHAHHTNICILLDLQGPKLRIGEVENNKIELKNGQKLLVTTEAIIGTSEKIYVNYKNLPKEVKVDEKILLDDGKIQLRVVSSNKKDIIETEVVYGGVLSSKKGFNLPDTKTSMPCLTEKDLKDLEFGLKHNVEWVALSFVRNASDIVELRNIIESRDKKTRIIAKIEKPEAVENFDEILKETDGVMVARGDLGVEMPLQQVPVIQKNIIKKCIIAGKPVIVATQMMESMIVNPSPTRAEVTDIANAVYDGADAVMLSAETSVGAYPVEAISMMRNILTEVEKESEVYFKGVKPTSE